jgi:hypothetical protein
MIEKKIRNWKIDTITGKDSNINNMNKILKELFNNTTTSSNKTTVIWSEKSWLLFYQTKDVIYINLDIYNEIFEVCDWYTYDIQLYIKWWIKTNFINSETFWFSKYILTFN